MVNARADRQNASEAIPTADASRITIDPVAVAGNWRRLAAMTRAECGAVVKADGYGLGAATVAPALAREGCDAVALSCTEIPLLVTPEVSPLPTIDSTRLLARAAVEVALDEAPRPTWRGGPMGHRAG